MATDLLTAFPEVEDGRNKVELDEEEGLANEVEHAASALADLTLDGPAASSSVLPFPPKILLDILNCDLSSADLAACALVASCFPLPAKSLGNKSVWSTFADSPHLREYVHSITFAFEEHDVSRLSDLRERIELHFESQVPPLLSALNNLEEIIWQSMGHDETGTEVFNQSWLLNVTSLDAPVFLPRMAFSLPSLTVLRTQAHLPDSIDTRIPPPARLQRLSLLYNAVSPRATDCFDWIIGGCRDTLTVLVLSYDFYLPQHHVRRRPAVINVDPLFRPNISHLTALRTLVLSAPTMRWQVSSGHPPVFPSWPPFLRHLTIHTLARRPFDALDPAPWLYSHAAGGIFPTTLYRLSLDRRVIPPADLIQLVAEGVELPQLRELDTSRARRDWAELAEEEEGETVTVEDLHEVCEERRIRLVP